ncbi:MAG: nicotinamide riboside transporter PnuC [bacterium]|nr:nicotinamide riboside transporter PnuC [bacterium]
MITVKPYNWKNFEIVGAFIICLILAANAVVFKDSLVAVFSAFFGITYTTLAGKGNPKCYLFGLAGSGLYGYLAFSNAVWGNLLLYMFYYIPMQTIGFFKWNNNLKAEKNEIIKTKLPPKERYIITTVSLSAILIFAGILCLTGDKSPVIDGITTVLSISGMYLTVKRCIEQWQVWMSVNGLSALMWIKIALEGEAVYSTVLMWIVYFILSIYFYKEWKKEVV